MNVSDFLELIIANNPEGVASRLTSSGISFQFDTMEDDLRKATENRDDQMAFLSKVLDVPILREGDYAEELFDIHSESANKNLLLTKVERIEIEEKENASNPFLVDLRLVGIGVGIAFGIVGFFALINLSIYLIRKS